MLELIIPNGVALESQTAFLDYPLDPEEVASLGKTVETRRMEFATGRHCAKQAMKSLGWHSGPIPIGLGREPIWPLGVVGSITHCQGYCAAVVAPLTQFVSIGIDAEQNLPLPTGVLDVISTTEESLTIPNLLDCGVNWDRLLFCAKESVFKAWYSITKQWLDFHECTIEWGKTEHIAPLERGCTVGKFIAELSRNYWLGNAAFRSFEGRFVFDRNHLATLVVVNQPFSQQF